METIGHGHGHDTRCTLHRVPRGLRVAAIARTHTDYGARAQHSETCPTRVKGGGHPCACGATRARAQLCMRLRGRIPCIRRCIRPRSARFAIACGSVHYTRSTRRRCPAVRSHRRRGAGGAGGAHRGAVRDTLTQVGHAILHTYGHAVACARPGGARRNRSGWGVELSWIGSGLGTSSHCGLQFSRGSVPRTAPGLGVDGLVGAEVAPHADGGVPPATCGRLAARLRVPARGPAEFMGAAHRREHRGHRGASRAGAASGQLRASEQPVLDKRKGNQERNLERGRSCMHAGKAADHAWQIIH